VPVLKQPICPFWKSRGRKMVGPFSKRAQGHLWAHICGRKKTAPRIFGPCLSKRAWGRFRGRFRQGCRSLRGPFLMNFAKQPPKRHAARFLSRLKPVLQPAYPLWLHRADRMASRPLFQTEGKGGPSFEYSLSLSLLSFHISRKSAARGPRQPL
jgi:hypothetical protein